MFGQASTSSTDRITLNEANLRRIGVKKVFDECKKPTSRVNALAISRDGRAMLSTTSEGVIGIWDCMSGTRRGEILSKKYGCGLICAQDESVGVVTKAVHSSTRDNDALRYLSLEKKSYISYFEGHTGLVTSLDNAAPTSRNAHMFLSGSVDGTVSVWDYRSPHRQGVVHAAPSGASVFTCLDPPDAVCFAVAVDKMPTLALYDVRSFDKAPFLSVNMDVHGGAGAYTQLAFSANGRYLLLCTRRSQVCVFDAINGTPLGTLTAYTGVDGDDFAAHACFTPDNKFVLCTAADRTIHVWHIGDGLISDDRKVCTIDVGNEDKLAPTCMVFNSKLMMLATGGRRVLFYSTEGSMTADG